jgi:hypothetical protein
MDVTFLAPDESALVPLSRVALRFDLPMPALPEPVTPVAPGMDPDRPPRLK